MKSVVDVETQAIFRVNETDRADRVLQLAKPLFSSDLDGAAILSASIQERTVEDVKTMAGKVYGRFQVRLDIEHEPDLDPEDIIARTEVSVSVPSYLQADVEDCGIENTRYFAASVDGPFFG